MESRLVVFHVDFPREQCVTHNLPPGRKTPLKEIHKIKPFTTGLMKITPTLGSYPRHFLEIKSVARNNNLHYGGIRTTIVMKDLHRDDRQNW